MSDTKTKSKPKTDLQIERQRLDLVTNNELDAPIESIRWRNLWFTTKSKSYRDQEIHASQEECIVQQKKLQDAINEATARGLLHFGIINTLDGYFRATIYSHGIAMPIGESE